jgi:hypothetical protein
VAAKKTDVSGYSGGTVTDLHHVPFAMATTKNVALRYKKRKSVSSFIL